MDGGPGGERRTFSGKHYDYSVQTHPARSSLFLVDVDKCRAAPGLQVLNVLINNNRRQRKR